MHFGIHDHPIPQMTLQKKFVGRQNLADKAAVVFDEDWTGALTFPSCRLQSWITFFSRGGISSMLDVKFLHGARSVITEENELNLHSFQINDTS